MRIRILSSELKRVSEDIVSGRQTIRVNEDEFAKRNRISRGFTKIVVIDPNPIGDEFEKRFNERLVHSPARLERLKGVSVLDSYPLVSGKTWDGKNKIDIGDGRHRIAEAIRQGSYIEVAMSPDYPIPDKYIVRRLN